jgi:formylglycine-generating enzyme required for sulfatase activity
MLDTTMDTAYGVDVSPDRLMYNHGIHGVMAPPAAAAAIAARRAPAKIKPWNGPMRGFSFDREVQPVLDRKCAGCHSGNDKDRPDFRAKRLHKDYKDKYSPAYMALQKYVRRAGFENDWHTPSPGEYQADTSHVVKMLKKGHHNVRLTRDEWDRLYTWIDFNIPYPANWTESHRNPNEKSVAKREELLRLYSAVNDPIETTALALPEIAKFEAPPRRKLEAAKLQVEGWPRKSDNGEHQSEELDLGDDIKMTLVRIGAGKFIMGDPNGFADERPRTAAIEQSFMMGVMEVSLQQYRQFDPDHENKFVSTRRKDQSRRGIFDMDSDPALPVVRISQDQAMAFCEWLSKKTGREVTLPSEEQWEWACRAGSDKAFSFGDHADGKGKEVMNIADSRIAGWNYGRFEKAFSDRFSYTKPVGVHIAPNGWGLHDMHGNVAEWTTSDYVPLKAVGGASGTERIPYKVVRGGSWNDTARFATSASRWRYPKYQPVYDVGFRVVVQPVNRLASARNWPRGSR